jgi:hypothetical protein
MEWSFKVAREDREISGGREEIRLAEWGTLILLQDLGKPTLILL